FRSGDEGVGFGRGGICVGLDVVEEALELPAVFGADPVEPGSETARTADEKDAAAGSAPPDDGQPAARGDRGHAIRGRVEDELIPRVGKGRIDLAHAANGALLLLTTRLGADDRAVP